MFRYLLCGQIAGLLLRLGTEPLLALAMLIAFPRRQLPGRVGLLGATLAFAGLGAGWLAAEGLHPGDPAEGHIEGIWRRSHFFNDGQFSGRLAGRGDILIRGLGSEVPIPGSRFEGEGILILSGRQEFRLRKWRSESNESALERNSRLGSLEGRSRWLFPQTRAYGDRQRPLARALLFGDRRGLAGSAKRAFRDAGLAHLLALSGLHVGLFLLLLRRVLMPGMRSPAAAEWVLLAIIPFLPAWGGGGPSILRAATMAGYVLLVRRLGGKPRGIEALAFAAFVELLQRPGSFFEPGFQLSYLATVSLLAFPRLRAGFGSPKVLRGLHYLREGAAASTLCTLSMLPVILPTFDRLPLAGPFWNLMASPLAALSLFAGWLSLPFGQIPGALVPSDFLFGALSDLAQIGGVRLRLLISGFDTPGWVWLPWGFGMRRIFDRRSLLGWILACAPILLCWLLGDGTLESGPPAF